MIVIQKSTATRAVNREKASDNEEAVARSRYRARPCSPSRIIMIVVVVAARAQKYRVSDSRNSGTHTVIRNVAVTRNKQLR